MYANHRRCLCCSLLVYANLCKSSRFKCLDGPGVSWEFMLIGVNVCKSMHTEETSLCIFCIIYGNLYNSTQIRTLPRQGPPKIVMFYADFMLIYVTVRKSNLRYSGADLLESALIYSDLCKCMQIKPVCPGLCWKLHDNLCKFMQIHARPV